MIDKILITNSIRLADYAQTSGVERIMVDLEYIGKQERQGHLDTVISNHSINDVGNIKKILRKSKLLVRVNPMNKESELEIKKVIDYGADIIMLPMFKTTEEVEKFIKYVKGQVKICLLLETSQALVRVDDILEIDGIDEVHIGLNDLHLSLGLNFMFELLSGGIVEYLSNKVLSKNIRFGFGGISRLGNGKLDSSLILSEHYRLGSSIVILSRDFKGNIDDSEEIMKKIDLKTEVHKINEYFAGLTLKTINELEYTKLLLHKKVLEILLNNQQI